MDDPQYPNSPDEVEGVRILGAQAVGSPADSAAPRRAPSAAATPSWDDEDDEEWEGEWDGDVDGAVDASDDEEWDTDESGAWGDDETGAIAARAPLANSVTDDGDAARGPRWRSGADDWADDEDLDDLDDQELKVGTLDPDRGDESELYRFKELDDLDAAPEADVDLDADAAEPLVRARAPRSGDGVSGRSGAKQASTKSAPRGTPPPPAAVVPAGLGARVVTAAGLLVAFFAIIFLFGRKGATALVAAVLLMAAIELFTALRHRGFAPAIIPGALACFAMPLVAFGTGETGMMLVFLLSVLVTVLWSLFRVVRDRPVGNMSVTLLTIGYIGALGGTGGLLLAHPNGLGLLLGGIVCTIASDVVAFFVGANLGKVPLAPEISPNKTVEGFVGGFFGSVLMGAIAFGVIGVAPWSGLAMGITLGVVVGVLAPLGDLAESMIKRDLGIKDMGSLLPGHGGLLDRVDAMLFVLPGVYFIARLKNWL